MATALRRRLGALRLRLRACGLPVMRLPSSEDTAAMPWPLRERLLPALLAPLDSRSADALADFARCAPPLMLPAVCPGVVIHRLGSGGREVW